MEKSVAKFTLLALPLFALTACQDYEPFSEAEVHATMAAREFAHNFEARYGKVDPNHTWGFGPIFAKSDVSYSATRTNIDNKNQWETVYHLQVPGWPDTYTDINGNICNNGYHYVNGGDKIGGDGYFYDANSNPRPSLDTNGILPGGDVTDEEIQYVSWWFRTHPNPGKLPIHCSDYFIQEISSDNDRNTDGSMSNIVGEYVKDSNGDWIPEIDANTGLAKTVTVQKFGLNDMQAKNFEGATSENIPGYDHMKNFNQEASNNFSGVANLYSVKTDTTQIWNCVVPKKTSQDGQIGSYRNIQYYTTSGTEDFAVMCNQDQSWKYEYALVHLQFVGKSGRVYDGYYLGFDYEMNKIDEMSGKRQYRAFDGYYSNWIVKLTPAVPYVEPNPFARRIMCEDLGNTFDFDFNDVVFDATYNIVDKSAYEEGDPIDVTITLRASGGTLPIYVGKDPQQLTEEQRAHYEAHHMMGRSTSDQPINVGKNSKTGTISTYHITMNSSDPGDIQIWVENKGNYYNIGNPLKRGNLDHYNGGTQITDENDANRSLAPQKFAVPVGTRWMQECEFIEDAYDQFPEWVSNENALPNGKPWYHNDNIKITGLGLLYSGSGDSGISGDVDVEGPSSFGEPIEVYLKEYGEYNKYYSIPLASIGTANSGKNYLVTFVFENVDLNNEGSIQRCSFGEYDINRENNVNIQSRNNDGTNSKKFEFVISSDKLDSSFSHYYLSGGYYNNNANTVVTCFVKEL